MYNLTIPPTSSASMSYAPASAPATTSASPFFPQQHSRHRPKLSLAIAPDSTAARYSCSRRTHSALNPPTLPPGLLSPTTKNTHLNARRSASPFAAGYDSSSSSSSSSGSDDDEEEEEYCYNTTQAYAQPARKPRRSSKNKPRVQFAEEVKVIPGEEGIYDVDERWQRKLF